MHTLCIVHADFIGLRMFVARKKVGVLLSINLQNIMDPKIGFTEYLKKDPSLKQEEIELICSYFQPECLKKKNLF